MKFTICFSIPNLIMKNERYPYYANTSFYDFEFHSFGPKGKIRKIATFILIKFSKKKFFFLINFTPS